MINRALLATTFVTWRTQYPGEIAKFLAGGWTFRDDKDYAFRRYRVKNKENETLVAHVVGGAFRLRVIRGRDREII